jgi:hypothetical protein
MDHDKKINLLHSDINILKSDINILNRPLIQNVAAQILKSAVQGHFFTNESLIHAELEKGNDSRLAQVATNFLP